MLIDNTYFGGTGLVNIPNVDPNIVTNEGNYAELMAYVKAYEPEICDLLIGETLYNALLAGLAETTPETRWTDLAAKLRDSVNLTSPIANYVWFKIWDKSHVQQTESGDIKLPGAESSFNNNLAIQIWNQMVKWAVDFQTWFIQNESNYVEWDGQYYVFTTQDRINNFGI